MSAENQLGLEAYQRDHHREDDDDGNYTHYDLGTAHLALLTATTCLLLRHKLTPKLANDIFYAHK
jgi:hypothetical protein